MVPSQPPPPRRGKKQLLLQGFLCVLCMLVGAFYPTLLDWSKTVIEREVTIVDGLLDTQERRAYPFSPISVVFFNDFTQLSIALCVVGGKEGLRALYGDRGLILKMLPLGAIYAIGELLTLRSIQKGSGPVYVVIANMKLVVAALMSRAFFGRSRSLPWLHWLELVIISLAAAAYTLFEAGSMGSEWHWEGAWMALTKSSLVAFSSVFCEHTYKSNKFLVVLTLQAAWGLITIVLLIGASFAGIAGASFATELHDDSGALSFFGSGPGLPLCASAAQAACVQGLSKGGFEVCRCVSRRGWDTYTLLAVFADLSNAISSALVFKKLSAVAKYVCRATSAVPMYLFYCVAGRSAWDLRKFSVVLYLCTQVSVYTLQRHRAGEAEEAKAEWSQHYATTSLTNDSEAGEKLRRRVPVAASDQI